MQAVTYTDSNIMTLHRYYIWANRMRTHFDEKLETITQNGIETQRLKIESMMYMSLWYGMLYVVIEGWKKSRFIDEKINKLIKSKNTDLLKEYRNGIFHFQPDYNDTRFENFFREQSTVQWVRSLNQEFGRWFLNALKRPNGNQRK